MEKRVMVDVDTLLLKFVVFSNYSLITHAYWSKCNGKYPTPKLVHPKMHINLPQTMQEYGHTTHSSDI